MKGHIDVNPRHCLGLLVECAKDQSKPWGKTVLRRTYYALRLQLPRRGKERLPARVNRPLAAATGPDQSLSCDFLADALWSGRRFKTFNVIDDYNRECLKIEIDTTLPSQRVVRALNELIEL